MMSESVSAAENDARLAQLRRWLAQELAVEDVALAPASADASFRRYFRFQHQGGSLIAMDAPPEQEDSTPFVEIADLLRRAGLHVPRILAQDLNQGFLLLEDLGNQTYLQVLEEGNADALFADAISALIDWQLASEPGTLPDYDEAELLRELRLFPDWYLQRHLGLALEPQERAELEQIFAAIVANARAQTQVFVHRDYMPRNLMVSTPNPGVLDFQDARFGPIAYDVASLFKDAFISWPQARVDEWVRSYWQQARERGLAVPETFSDFQRDLDWIGVQRHLKVLSIFARINYRDGKPRYLADAPRFLDYLAPVVARYPQLAPLSQWLQPAGPAQ